MTMLTREPVVRTGAPRSIAEFLNPIRLVGNLWTHREIIWQFTKRDIAGRYRGARLGLLWAVLTPILLLVIYTFVFAVVFSSKWGDDEQESRGVFALTMFCGLLVYNLFAEVANRTPTLIVYNPNYVKKVVFPLEIFTVSSLFSALFTMLIGLGAWVVGMVVIVGLPPWTFLWFPVVLLPVCLATLGIGWMLASLGVFVRDIGHAVQIVVQVLFFLTPIFYSLERVPERYRPILVINPLTHAVEDMRRVMMWGGHPEWGWWCTSLCLSVALAVLGYAFFMKSKRAFADVV